METYLLKSAICLFVFWLVYKTLFQTENMHNAKRFYLLLALAASFTIPLLYFTEYVTVSPVTTITEPIFYNNGSEGITPSKETKMMPYILWIIYGVGVLIMGYKFLINISSLIEKIQCNPIQKRRNFIHVLLKEITVPHSFFNYIFLNKEAYKNNRIPTEIMLHEQAHAQQKHTIDVLLAEALQVLFWFNPLVYLLKKEIKLNHEFLADQAVLNHGIPTTTYQELLLTLSTNNNCNTLAHAINYSSIKKRLTVMKTNTSKQTAWLKSLLLLPLLAVLIWSFSNKKIVESITIYVNNNNQILFGDDSITASAIPQKIATIQNALTPEEITLVTATIYVAPNATLDIVTDIEEALRKSNVTNINRLLWTDPLQQNEGASESMMKEYNDFMTQYEKNKIINNAKYNRAVAIYDMMTNAQRKTVKKYPKLPEINLTKVVSQKPTKELFE